MSEGFGCQKLFIDVKLLIQKYEFDIIFDVGANIGQTVLLMADLFSFARFFTFEPVALSFGQLKAGTINKHNIECFNFAVGSENKIIKMQSKGTSTSNRILDGTGLEHHGKPVQMITGSQFCVEHKIDKISFLKIDTKGHDLEVVKGFNDIIDRINFI